jgi:hypothetical protein
MHLLDIHEYIHGYMQGYMSMDTSMGISMDICIDMSFAISIDISMNISMDRGPRLPAEAGPRTAPCCRPADRAPAVQAPRNP